MSDSDRLVLREIIRQEKQNSVPSAKDTDFFEIFSTDQILKDRGFDLDLEQVGSGIVGGGDDGGVDAFYTFANRRLVREDSDLSSLAEQQLAIEVVAVQSKMSDSFRESAITKLIDFTDNCLRLTAYPAAESKGLYKDQLLQSVRIFTPAQKRFDQKAEIINRLCIRNDW